MVGNEINEEDSFEVKKQNMIFPEDRKNEFIHITNDRFYWVKDGYFIEIRNISFDE